MVKEKQGFDKPDELCHQSPQEQWNLHYGQAYMNNKKKTRIRDLNTANFF